MIRYFCGLCLLIGSIGNPALAKGIVAPGSLSPASSKAMATDVPAPVAHVASAPVKAQSHKIKEVTLTPDISRGDKTPLAFKEAPAEPAPKATAHADPRVVEDKDVTLETSKNRSTMIYSANMPVQADGGAVQACQRLARVTAYWAAEGDYYTGRGISATGVRLHDGLCAVDPSIIPYGSVVEIAGIGKYLAVDTGSAVIARLAAREGGHTSAERNALVIDIFFESRLDGEKFAAAAAKYTTISWWTPMATDTLAREARSLFADEDWLKIQSKQL